MSDQRETELRLEGTVRASRYQPAIEGKQFLGVIIECADGREWVIDYDEQSPFHAFADRRVVASGRPYTPEGQCIGGDRIAGHFRVSTMRLVEVTPDAEFVEVGPARPLSGQFERGTSHSGKTTLSFISANGDTFLVANNPAGAVTGRRVDVLAYPVEPSPSSLNPHAQYLWIICPCSSADLSKWRERNS